MRSFQSMTFEWIRTYREIFKPLKKDSKETATTPQKKIALGKIDHKLDFNLQINHTST